MVSDTQISEMLRGVWMTITVGFGVEDGHNFCEILKGNNFNITPRAESMLKNPNFVVASKKMDLDLVRFVVGDITSGEDTPCDEIRAIVKEFGLVPFSTSLSGIGPHLRLQYLDQRNNEQLLIDMEPIDDSDGDPSMFGVKCVNHKKVLYADYGHTRIIYPSDAELIYLRPRVAL